jgi:hypothetical protein
VRVDTGEAAVEAVLALAPDLVLMDECGIAEALVLTPRAVEKRINVIFSKLPLDQQPGGDRCVTAVFVFLAETA